MEFVPNCYTEGAMHRPFPLRQLREYFPALCSKFQLDYDGYDIQRMFHLCLATLVNLFSSYYVRYDRNWCSQFQF